LTVAVAIVVAGYGGLAAAGASAARFQANEETGSLSGVATNTQVLTVNGGKIECTAAAISGSLEAYESEEQKVTVNYSGCKAFGFTGVTVSPAEYDYHAGGTVDVLNTITINVAGFCSVTVKPQAGLSAVTYENNAGKVRIKHALTGIAYETGGGLCGAKGVNGTFSGNDEVEVAGGGFIAVLLGGSLSKKTFLNGVRKQRPDLCKFAAKNDICKIEFAVTGAGEGWRVQTNGAFKGDAGAAGRYEVIKQECTNPKLLKNGEKCVDEIKAKEIELTKKNEWCVEWETEGAGLKNVPFCTKLEM
jgi:hypothetical protein